MATLSKAEQQFWPATQLCGNISPSIRTMNLAQCLQQMVNTFGEAACPAIGFKSWKVPFSLPVIIKLFSDAHDAPQAAQVGLFGNC
jgi:hypothetical protein